MKSVNQASMELIAVRSAVITVLVMVTLATMSRESAVRTNVTKDIQGRNVMKSVNQASMELIAVRSAVITVLVMVTLATMSRESAVRTNVTKDIQGRNVMKSVNQASMELSVVRSAVITVLVMVTLATMSRESAVRTNVTQDIQGRNVMKNVRLEAMGMAVHAAVAHTVRVLVEPVRQAVSQGTEDQSVLNNVKLEAMELDVHVHVVHTVWGVVATAPDHTTPVTVLVELVRQAVSQGTEDQSVLNDVTEAFTVNNVRKAVVCIVDGPAVTMSTGFVAMAVTLVTMILYVHRNVLLGNTETDVCTTAATPVLDQTMPVTMWMGSVVPVIQVTGATNVI
ncbi:hypothetical protein RRG08_053979 [Elysia crispata]|uniref:Uncharacterized protein n=1 Tax=Elysia crispata TaxID=231223 RepID=A0AAE0XNF7_9GAST|nr:hypothetical protein RRG08_053979 [Elysia crispata]